MYGTQINNPGLFEKVVNFATNSLKEIAFDTLVFRGFSGALVGPTVANRLQKPWALVRKPGDNAHSNKTLEGKVKGKYVIIDDFIETGATILAIETAISHCYYQELEQVHILYGTGGAVAKEFEENKPVCLGVALYEESWCNKMPDDQQWYESKIGGLKVLNWTYKAEITGPTGPIGMMGSNFFQQAVRCVRPLNSAPLNFISTKMPDGKIAFDIECMKAFDVMVTRPVEELKEAEIAF